MFTETTGEGGGGLEGIIAHSRGEAWWQMAVNTMWKVDRESQVRGWESRDSRAQKGKS